MQLDKKELVKILKEQGINNIKFMVMGDGPLRNRFEEYAKQQNIYVEFTGKLNYKEMVGILSVCDLAVNPIVKNSAASIINKHADYVAAALPILNTQESTEFRDLLIKYNAGINCNNNDPEDLADKLLLLYKNEEMRRNMSNNSRRLAEDKFDRLKTYQEIVDLIKNN